MKSKIYNGEKIYLAVNSDGSEIISRKELKRFFSYEENKKDVICWNDTQLVPHWIIIPPADTPRTGYAPIGDYIIVPQGTIKKITGRDMTWDDAPIVLQDYLNSL